MDKKIEIVTILENKFIAKDVCEISFNYSFDVEPGQFVNLYLNSKDKLLPRPISVCRKEGDFLTLVYGVVGKEQRNFPAMKKAAR